MSLSLARAPWARTWRTGWSGRPDGSPGRGGTGRRRVFLLGLHALEGAPAAGHCTARRADRSRRQGSCHPHPGRGRRAQAPRPFHLELEGRQPGQVGRGHRDRADPRPRPDHRAAAVEVAGRDGNSYALTARHAVVLATGSTPTRPPVEGLVRHRVLDHPGGDLRPRSSGTGWRCWAAAWPAPNWPRPSPGLAPR